MAFRRCRICGKRLYDNYDTAELSEEAEENEIRDGLGDTSTPESRTLALRDRHERIKHPTEAEAFGLSRMTDKELMGAVDA